MSNIDKDLMLNEEVGENEGIDLITHTFKKPVKFEGKEYKEIILDLEGLTGQDVQDVSNEMLAKGISLGLAEVNKSFLSAMASRAANVPVEFMNSLPAREFSSITVQVQNFLLM